MEKYKTPHEISKNKKRTIFKGKQTTFLIDAQKSAELRRIIQNADRELA